jgi:hypothetical protein
MKFSDIEIDQLLASVEDAMAQASKLAKSQPMQKDADADQDDQQAAPAMDAQAPESAPAMDAAPAADAQAAPDQDQGQDQAPEGSPEDQIQDEGQDQGEISDEELHQIYASMDENELHRHLTAIEAALGGGQDQGQEQEQQAPEQAPAAAPAPASMTDQMAMKSEQTVSDLNKSETKKLQDENDALKKSLDKVISAMGKAFQPTRKAVTDIEYIQKSESQTDERPLTKSETVAQLNKIVKSNSLSKADRQAINDYILADGSQEQVKKILKGGK